MTKSAVTTHSRQTEGAANAAPLVAALPIRKPGRFTRLKRVVVLPFTLAALLLALTRLAWFSAPIQNWRWSRAALPALLRERATHPDNPCLLYYVGARLNAAGRFAEAEDALRHAVGIDPDAAELRDEWARAQLGSGQISAAYTQLRQFAGTHPRSAPAHLALGKFYFAQTSMRRAAEELQEAVALDPQQSEAWAYLSQASAQLGEADRPLEAARHAVALRPENARYHLLLAPLLARANRPDEAGQEYARAVALAPKNAVMRREYALWLSQHASDPGALRRAEAEARQAAALDSQDGTASFVLGDVLRRQGRAQEAIAPLKQAADRLPTYPAPAQALAQVYQALGRLPEARSWQDVYTRRQSFVSERNALYQQLRVHPDDRALHLKMALLLGKQGDVDGCIGNYATALRQSKDSVFVLTAAARALTQGGFVAQALPLARRAVVLGPHNPESREAFGDALLQSGQVDAAIANYNYTTNYIPARTHAIQARVNRYVAAHPQPLPTAEAAYRQARALMDNQIGLHRIPLRAEELAQKAVGLEPDDTEYLRLLLRIQFEMKEASAAMATARQILLITPEDARTRALLAVLLADRGKGQEDFAEAEQHLRAIAGVAAVAAQRHYALGLLALHQRQGDLAVAELTQAAQLDPNADITFYKIAQAERMAGHAAESERAMARYEARMRQKRAEFNAQSDISQHPNDPAAYLRLARFYQQQGRSDEERAIRAVAQRRFAPEPLRRAEAQLSSDTHSNASP